MSKMIILYIFVLIFKNDNINMLKMIILYFLISFSILSYFLIVLIFLIQSKQK
jgi:hypothetical protein